MKRGMLEGSQIIGNNSTAWERLECIEYMVRTDREYQETERLAFHNTYTYVPLLR